MTPLFTTTFTVLTALVMALGYGTLAVSIRQANIEVLIALNFFATGSYQTPVGNSRFTSVSQTSVSRCLEQVTSALNEENLFGKWVKFPSNLRELREVRNGFYATTGFQGCIECIDCTHVAIVPPLKDPLNAHAEYIYINRKGYHSINVQLVE